MKKYHKSKHLSKLKKTVSPEKYEQLKQARLKGAEKKKEMKELKNKAKQLQLVF